jgi:hypothetical protein
MNTFGTPRPTHLRFLAASDEDGEPAPDPEPEPGAEHEPDAEDEQEAEDAQDAEGEQDTEDEQDAAHGRYARLPGRDPIDLEALSDLSLD